MSPRIQCKKNNLVDNDTVNTDPVDTGTISENAENAIIQEAVSNSINYMESKFLEIVSNIERSDLHAIWKNPKILMSHLQNIIQLYKKCPDASNEYLKHFPDWCPQRVDNIIFLNAIADKLDDCRKGCNISRLVGSSIGIVGGATAITGAVLIPFTGGLSAPLMLAGATMGGLGGASNIATAITETLVIEQKVEEAKVRLDKDREDFKPLEIWLEHATEFVNAVEQVVSFNAFENILTCITDFINDDIHRPDLPWLFPKIARELWQQLNNALEINDTTVHNDFLEYLKVFFTDSSLLSLVTELADLHKNNILIFETIMLTSRIVLQLGKVVDFGADAATAVASLAKGGAVVSKSVGQAVAHTVLSGIGVALDAVNIILTTVDMVDGSQCSSAKQIRKAVDELQKELDCLEKIRTSLLRGSTAKI